MVGIVLDKSLRLDYRKAQDLAAVSIMSTDVESIEPAIILFHDLWSGIVDISVGLYVLVTMVKQSTFLAVLPTICKSSTFFTVLHVYIYPSLPCLPAP